MATAMASQMFDFSSIESFGPPVYSISTTDFSNTTYDDTLTDLSSEKTLLSSVYDESIVTSNGDVNLLQSSTDDIHDFLKEFLQFPPNGTDYQHLHAIANSSNVTENQAPTTNATAMGPPQFPDVAPTPSTPHFVTLANMVLPDLDMTMTTPLTSRQWRYRSQPAQICETCGKTFRARQHLQRHRLEKHTDLDLDEKFAHPCKQCDKRFKRREHLKLHERAKHSGVKNYGCNSCGKRFVTKSHLKRHLARHERKKAEGVTCTGCGRVFAKKGNLMRHEANGRCIGTRSTGQG